MPAGFKTRRANCHAQVRCSDDSVRKDENRIVAIVPANPWRKVYALGLALRSDQLVERPFILRLHVREIGSKILEGLGQSLSIVEIGNRKIHVPQTSINIAIFN